MPAHITRALITGATGRIGGAVLRQLKGDQRVQAIVAARVPEKAAELGFPVVQFDYDKPETITPALDGIDSIFVVTGYTVDMLRQTKGLVDHARKSGVRHIVHLGACGSDDVEVAHHGWHQFVERYIEWSGIAYTHLRPEIYMQILLGYGGVPIVREGVIRHFIGAGRISWVDGDDVAAVAAICLRDPASHSGKTYRLGYEAKDFYEIAQIMTSVIGKPFSYEPLPAEDFLSRVLAAGGEPAYMRSAYQNYKNLAEGKATGADETFDNFRSLTGRQAGSIETFFGRHRAQFVY
jgi:NAD(P)H dehydrogenase (quinone)